MKKFIDLKRFHEFEKNHQIRKKKIKNGKKKKGKKKQENLLKDVTYHIRLTDQVFSIVYHETGGC